MATAWAARRSTLAAYRDQLAPHREPITVLRTLLHDHHVRAIGVDPDLETFTNRLARAAVLRHLARPGKKVR
ncbi:hypothetical protein [Thermocatellispora tengchongensis]|uniref:hypothetical protein n=1 Tax=Thermocatellispora tengchongensis TaxID=1073253 RepID=UPI00362CD275